MKPPMRMMAALLLALILLAACGAASAENTGIWQKKVYLDEHDMPTGEYCVSNAEPFIGRIVGANGEEAELQVYLTFDAYAHLQLLRNDGQVIANRGAQDVRFNVIMMDTAGERHYFAGRMASGAYFVNFSVEGDDAIWEALQGSGTVYFSLEDAGGALYNFSIEDTAGFADFYETYTRERKVGEGAMPVVRDGKWGYVNAAGELVIPCEYDYASMSDGSVARVKRNGRWGFLNGRGEETLPCEYDSIGEFVGGLAEIRQGDKVGRIGSDGSMVIPCECDSIEAFENGGLEVWRGGKVGLVDGDGAVIIPCEYDSMERWNAHMVKVTKDGKMGLTDSATGEAVYACEYDSIDTRWNSEARTTVSLTKIEKDGKAGLVNSATNEEILPCEYDRIDSLSSHRYMQSGGSYTIGSSSYSAPAYAVTEYAAVISQNGKYGFVDENGKIFIGLQYEDAKALTEFITSFSTSGNSVLNTTQYNYASRAAVKQNGKWGYIDHAGKLVIDCQYDSAESFEGRTTTVQLNGESFKIDYTGKRID